MKMGEKGRWLEVRHFSLLERGADKELPGEKSSRQLSAKTRTYPIGALRFD